MNCIKILRVVGGKNFSQKFISFNVFRYHGGSDDTVASRVHIVAKIKNYSPKTVKQYTLCVGHFAKFFNKCPSELGPKEIKKYLLYLIDERKSSWSQYRQTICGLRHLYTKVLGLEWMAEHIPFPRRGKALPQCLTPEEVKAVLAVIEHPKHRMMLETIYATGVRWQSKGAI